MRTVLLFLFSIGIVISAEDKIDGSLLSNELKKIKKGVGIDHMQAQFDSFPYEEKTDTGNQLLQNIQNSLETSLTDLNEVLTKIKDKKSNYADSSSSSLPKCCDRTGNYKYNPKFGKEVDTTTACVTRSPIDVTNLKYPPDEISDAMKTNYDNNRNVLWQQYSSTEGVSILYPSTFWENCQNYDPRFTSSYAAAASPKDKDVVIVLDTSSSMKQPSGIPDKTKMVIAKEAANNVIQTLKPNDRFGIVSFDKDVSTPSGSSYHSCYQNKLAFATKENTDKMRQYVFSVSESSSPNSEFDKALETAFGFFVSSENSTNTDTRDQVILFVSDGKSTSTKDPIQVISDQNKQLQNRIMIFTFLIGPDDDAKIQMSNMARQTSYNSSAGEIRGGKYTYVSQGDHKLLSTKLATFFIDLPADRQGDSSTFTVPYVELFSSVGLVTSLCLPVYGNSGLHGVACTDVKISELLTEVEYFSEEEYSYAFIIDGTGRTLMHPLLPDAAFVKSDEDPVLVDIRVLERAPEAVDLIDSMKRGGSGSKSFHQYFTKPRGRLLNDGSAHIRVHSNYFWGPVPKSNFSLCVVLDDSTYSEINEFQFTPSNDLNNVFMYHNRSLLADNFPNCKFYKRRVTLDRSCVKFSGAAFSNPFVYLDRDETSEDVTKYQNYLTKRSSINPGFRETLRSSVWATYKAEQFWKANPARYVSWRYIGTKAGMIRIYPGVSLLKSYDHQKRTWWRQAVARPNTMVITSPYVDAWGSGIVLSFIHTIFKKGTTQITAVAGADFPLEYFNWFISNMYPSCEKDYSCIIVDDSGFIVMHPRLKETTDESQFKGPKHITIDEPGIAKKMKINSVLNSLECQDFSVNIDLLSYRVTLPDDKKGGLDFSDTNDYFELRPVSETNLFIIRVKKPSVAPCSCDPSKSPDAVTCSDSCDCLCHTDMVHDSCANDYNTRDASLPCSARLPDTSGVSVPDPDNIAGLDTCYVATCHEKESKIACLGEAECSWCEYTNIGIRIETPCCRLKEECSFGKTKSTNKDTCAPPTTKQPTTEPTSAKNIGAVVGGSIAAGVIATVFVVGFIYCWRHRNKFDTTDPYIDAVPDRMDMEQFSEKDETGSTESPPPPYSSKQNVYVQQHI